MLFSRFAILPSLAFARSLPRDILPTGQTVKQDVINIHNAVLALDNTINSYQGVPLPTSLVEGTPVLLGVAEIHRVNRAGFRHALAALPFTVEDSRDVIDAVVDTGTYRLHYPRARADWTVSQCIHSQIHARSESQGRRIQARRPRPRRHRKLDPTPERPRYIQRRNTCENRPSRRARENQARRRRSREHPQCYRRCYQVLRNESCLVYHPKNLLYHPFFRPSFHVFPSCSKSNIFLFPCRSRSACHKSALSVIIQLNPWRSSQSKSLR